MVRWKLSFLGNSRCLEKVVSENSSTGVTGTFSMGISLVNGLETIVTE